MGNMVVVKENHVLCEECGNADSGNTVFIASSKIDDRLSKDNFKFYKVVGVFGGGTEFSYPKITLSVGDIVITEALGIDIEYSGGKFKVFDTDHIVSKMKGI